MATARLLQTNFSAGELSPRVDGRPDLARYFNGAKTLENVFVFPQGGATRRTGTRKVREVKDSTKKTYPIPFEFNIEQAYMIEAGNLYFRFYKDNEVLFGVTGSEKIANGTFDTALTSWTEENDGAADVIWDAGKAKFFSAVGGAATCNLRQSITTVAAQLTRLSFKLTGNTPGTFLKVIIGTSEEGSQILSGDFLDAGNYDIEFTPTGVTTWIEFLFLSTTSSDARYIDDVSCKAVDSNPYEVSTPYSDTDVPFLQYRQSADVMYIVHPDHAPRKLTRISDTNWTLAVVNFDPPPTFEADEDLNAGGGSTTLTPAATTGTGILFTASTAIFLVGDVDRMIVYQSSRAIITAVDAGLAIVTADILDDFPSTSAIPAGEWFLRGSSGVTLDPNRKEPIGVEVQLTASANAFRANVVGKYIRVFDAIIEITTRTSATALRGTLKSLMSESAGTGKNPAAALEGTWHLEVPAFSATYGYPAAIEFHEGRLALGGTDQQPTTWWMSASDSYENFARGTVASDGVEYTIASRKVNKISYLISNGPLAIGTAENELIAKGAGTDEPLGGDVIPVVRAQSEKGSSPIQPLVTSDAMIFVTRAGRQVIAWDFAFDRDKFQPEDLTLLSEHITLPSLAQTQICFEKEPDPRMYFPRTDGQMLALTYYRIPEQVIAWSRIVTDGEIEGVAVIPHPDGDKFQVWITCKRTIDGATVRFMEYFDTDAPEMDTRDWTELYTDCAAVYDGAATTTPTGFDHLDGEECDVVADGVYVGRKTVAAGSVTLDNAASVVEVGLPYTSTIVSMRPTIPGASTEGRFKRWVEPFIRLYKSLGGTIQGKAIEQKLSGEYIDWNAGIYTGDAKITDLGWNEEGRLTIVQDKPLPFTVLCAGGKAEFA